MTQTQPVKHKQAEEEMINVNKYLLFLSIGISKNLPQSSDMETCQLIVQNLGKYLPNIV